MITLVRHPSFRPIPHHIDAKQDEPIQVQKAIFQINGKRNTITPARARAAWQAVLLRRAPNTEQEQSQCSKQEVLEKRFTPARPEIFYRSDRTTINPKPEKSPLRSTSLKSAVTDR